MDNNIKNQIGFSDLNDCYFHIFKFLNVNDVINCSLVNKIININTKNNLLWYVLLVNKYHVSKYHNNCYVIYKKYYTLNKYLKSINAGKSVKKTMLNRELRLWNINLQTLPNEIEMLYNLDTLELERNKLYIFPTCIFKLNNLRILTMDSNGLQVLPPEIGLLVNLEEIILNGNKLRVIPKEIGLLTNLKTLFLHNNQLETLPLEIKNITGLEVITLFGNNLNHIAPFIEDYFDIDIVTFMGIKLRDIVNYSEYFLH